MAEDKLRALSAVVRTKETDPDFEDLRKYSQNVKVSILIKKNKVEFTSKKKRMQISFKL